MEIPLATLPENRLNAFVRLASHFNHHIGQIIDPNRELQEPARSGLELKAGGSHAVHLSPHQPIDHHYDYRHDQGRSQE